jgi:hypothetical protein
MPGTKLREKTLTLLRERPATVKLKQISEGCGLSEEWIKSFHLGNVEHPSVVRVEILYEYLSKTKLKV